VVERRQRDIDIFQQAVVRPIIDFRQLEVVAIVTNFNPLENVPDVILEPTEALVPETSEPLLVPTATPSP